MTDRLPGFVCNVLCNKSHQHTNYYFQLNFNKETRKRKRDLIRQFYFFYFFCFFETKMFWDDRISHRLYWKIWQSNTLRKDLQFFPIFYLIWRILMLLFYLVFLVEINIFIISNEFKKQFSTLILNDIIDWIL